MNLVFFSISRAAIQLLQCISFLHTCGEYFQKIIQNGSFRIVRDDGSDMVMAAPEDEGDEVLL